MFLSFRHNFRSLFLSSLSFAFIFFQLSISVSVFFIIINHFLPLFVMLQGVEALLNLPGCSTSADSVSVLSLILQVSSLATPLHRLTLSALFYQNRFHSSSSSSKSILFSTNVTRSFGHALFCTINVLAVLSMT